MTPADVLNAAADLIDEKGWVQSRSVGPNGEYCARAAVITAASKKGEGPFPALGILWDYIKDTARSPSVSAWNDTPGRTQAGVVAALRAAAESA